MIEIYINFQFAFDHNIYNLRLFPPLETLETKGNQKIGNPQNKTKKTKQTKMLTAAKIKKWKKSISCPHSNLCFILTSIGNITAGYL